ncbi:MAG: hypothetical protein K8R53_04885 [Bacteroidales bacterium]|nr:hypothetical protein [Bacteroidales bacterium]
MTTAYRDYALEAFELDVIDYLLKPISQERRMKAIQKYYKSASGDLQITESSDPAGEKDNYLFVKADRKIQKIFLDDIEIGKEELPIGRSYKNEVMKALKFRME